VNPVCEGCLRSDNCQRHKYLLDAIEERGRCPVGCNLQEYRVYRMSWPTGDKVWQ